MARRGDRGGSRGGAGDQDHKPPEKLLHGADPCDPSWTLPPDLLTNGPLRWIQGTQGRLQTSVLLFGPFDLGGSRRP